MYIVFGGDYGANHRWPLGTGYVKYFNATPLYMQPLYNNNIYA